MTHKQFATLILIASSLAQSVAMASNGRVAFYSDPAGTNPVTSISAASSPNFVYMFLELEGPALTDGIGAVSGKISTSPLGPGTFIGSEAYRPDGSLGGGTNIFLGDGSLLIYGGAQSCVTSTAGFSVGRIRVARIYGFASPPQEIFLWADEVATGYGCAGDGGTPAIVLCDPPMTAGDATSGTQPSMPMLSIGNTPDGANVVVQPRSGVDASIEFATVSVQGQTSLDVASPCTADIPANYSILPTSAPICYGIRTTASTSGPMVICLPYDDSGLTPEEEATAQIVQCDSQGLNCVFLPPSSHDTQANRVCGIATELGTFTVAIRQTTSDSEDLVRRSPQGNRLWGNHPNPFNPTTTVSYELVESATVKLAIYDATSRLVRVLEGSSPKSAGRHETTWDGRDDRGQTVGSGIYFCRLEIGEEILSARLTLLK